MYLKCRALRRFLCLLTACVLSAAALCLPAAGARAENIKLTCMFADVGIGRDLTWLFDYSDELFSRSAEEYHHDLARVSLGLALSAFRENINHDPDFIADNNVIDYLSEAGFSDFESTDYDQTPSLQTVATVISSKKMRDAEGEFTLIAVGICGGGYKNEWLSNFSVGDGLRHLGFNRAAQNVEGRILLYMTSRRITGRMKLWVTGYSRAAAISNIVGADMTDYGPFGEKNTFVYTFATPRTTREPVTEPYTNIYNIVGKMDVVPMVPLPDWGFHRYGTDLYTPAQETDVDYPARLARAGKAFSKLTGMEIWNNPEINHRLHTFVSYLLKLCPDTAAYTKYLEDQLKNMWTNRTVIGLTGGLISLLSNENLITDDNRDEVDALVNLTFNMGINLIAQSGSIQLNWNRHSGPIANLMHEHLPSVYLSWMFSSDDPAEIFSDRLKYQRIIVQGNITLSCFDQEGQPFRTMDETGSVTDSPMDPAAETRPFMMRSAPYSVIVVPEDAPYDVGESTIEDEKVTVSIIDFDLSTLDVLSGFRFSLLQKKGLNTSLEINALKQLLDMGLTLKEDEQPTFEELEDDEVWIDELDRFDTKLLYSTRFVESLEAANVFNISRIGLLNLIIITPIVLVLLLILIPTLLLLRRRKKKRAKNPQEKKPRRQAKQKQDGKNQ